MSAILGIVYLDGRPVTAQTLQPALDATAFYGGDGHGVWLGGSVGLAFHQQIVTPESVFETLPFQRGPTVITADARLDNRAELFDQLTISHSARESMPDSALILHAYERWGADCARYLLGDFAFVVWDERERRLYCARDFIGARPFFYYHAAGVFAFASDLTALFRFADVRAEIDESHVAEALAHAGFSYYHPARTFFQHIYRLPFAQQMTVSAAGVTLSPHWQPPSDTLHLPSEADYVERTRELLDAAVACRLRTDHGVGAHLSGGVDSSSVAVIAARQLHAQGRDLRAYSWSPPAGPNPDRQLEQYRIETIARAEGLNCCYRPMVARSVGGMAGAGPVMMEVEQPVMQQAAADGVRVMLSGWGGDEFISFNGRGIRADDFLHGRWWALIKTFPWGRHRTYGRVFLNGLWHDVALVFAPDAIYRRWSAHGAQQAPENTFLAADFRAKVGSPKLDRYQVRGRRRNQINLFEDGHLTERIESWAAGGAAQRITYAYPLLDRRLVEFAFQVPDTLYLKDGLTRYLFRRAMEPLFPEGLVWTDVKTQGGMNRHIQVVSQFAWRAAENDPERMDPEALLSEGDVLWLDVARLRETLRTPLADLPFADQMAVTRALQVIQLLRFLQTQVK